MRANLARSSVCSAVAVAVAVQNRTEQRWWRMSDGQGENGENEIVCNCTAGTFYYLVADMARGFGVSRTSQPQRLVNVITDSQPRPSAPHRYPAQAWLTRHSP